MTGAHTAGSADLDGQPMADDNFDHYAILYSLFSMVNARKIVSQLGFYLSGSSFLLPSTGANREANIMGKLYL